MPLLAWGASGAVAVIASRLMMPPETAAYMPLWWERGFVPWDIRAIPYAVMLVYGAFLMLGSWWIVPVAVLFAVLGIRREPRAAVPYLIPAGLILLAAAAHLYPFGLPVQAGHQERVIIGLLPGMCILVASGMAKLVRDAPRAGRVVAAYLLVTLVIGVAQQIPDVREDVRPVFAHIAAHRQPGDRLSLGRIAPCYMRYYGAALADMDTTGVMEAAAGGHRTWIVRAWADTLKADTILKFLGPAATRVQVDRARWVELLLFDPRRARIAQEARVLDAAVSGRTRAGS
jgi:hypothetical protein